MLRILAMPAVMLASVAFAAVAVGQVTRTEPNPKPLQYRQIELAVAPKVVLPPLRLPNISTQLQRLENVSRTTAARQMVASANVLRFWRNHRWVLASRHEKCWEVPWQRSCTVARASLRLHAALTAAAEERLVHEIPVTNDWRTAVRLTQRVFPGTDGWLLFISDREGGYGGFVMNHQGSGAGGWMQFMASTFYAYADDARAAVQSKGFQIDPSVWSWTNPLGQALTAGYMRYTGRDGCHWCL